MRYLNLFKSSLNSTLDRNYCLDQWIYDHSLVILLKQNYHFLDFINKSYLNKYIQLIYL